MFNLEASRRGWQQARMDGREAHVDDHQPHVFAISKPLRKSRRRSGDIGIAW
ncbi:MAG: hypothetical protein J0I23_12665 [Rhizobiales bacterium]|nr:hypothetical protein [Hyphomicrobiales bacterium]